MARRLTLDVVTVEDPCPLPWDALPGSGPVRHCGTCRSNVYDLSQMTTDEALALVERTEGRLCVQYYARADGTITTLDCAPSRLEAARRVAKRALGAASMLTSAVLAITLGLAAVVLGWVSRDTAAPIVDKLERVSKLMMPAYVTVDPPPPSIGRPHSLRRGGVGRVRAPHGDPTLIE